MPADFDQESKALAADSNECNDLLRASDSNSMESGVMEEYSEKPPPPPRRRFYKQKKYWIICSIITAIIVVVVVCLVVFVFFPMIAQSLMNQAGIDVDNAQITFNPPDNLQKRDNLNMNTSFYMHMESKMSNTGPFPASLNSTILSMFTTMIRCLETSPYPTAAFLEVPVNSRPIRRS